MDGILYGGHQLLIFEKHGVGRMIEMHVIMADYVNETFFLAQIRCLKENKGAVRSTRAVNDRRSRSNDKRMTTAT